MSPKQDAHDAPVQERILAAAAEVFAEVGFGGARVDEIARRAGINKAMLYYHVGDKEALFHAVLARNFTVLAEAVATAVAGDDPAPAKLRRLVRAMVETLDTIPHHPRIMLREVASGGAHLPDDVVTMIASLLGHVRGLLADGAAEGSFRRVSPILTHLTLIGTVVFMTATEPLRERFSRLGIDLDAPDDRDGLVDFLHDMLLHGLAAPGGNGGSR